MKPRLLKRIKSWEVNASVTASDVDANEIMESLRDDIEKLFNTRRGTVMIDNNYGLADFTHLMNGYAAPDVEVIERDLLNQVRKYEPRLASVKLSYQDTKSKSSNLKFILNSSFKHKNQDLNFLATVTFSENGSIGVSL